MDIALGFIADQMRSIASAKECGDVAEVMRLTSDLVAESSKHARYIEATVRYMDQQDERIKQLELLAGIKEAV